MRELTNATPILGDVVFLGNMNDVPARLWRAARGLGVGSGSDRRDGSGSGGGGAGPSSTRRSGSSPHAHSQASEEEDDPFDNWDNPMGYDICIECRDGAELPVEVHLDAARRHLATLDAIWSERQYQKVYAGGGGGGSGGVKSSSPASSSSSSTDDSRTHRDPPMRKPRPAPSAQHILHFSFPASPASCRWLIWPFLEFLSSVITPNQHPPATRPMRVLVYSNDGYTDSSVLALSLIMNECKIDLPSAYLELHVSCFFFHFLLSPSPLLCLRWGKRKGLICILYFVLGRERTFVLCIPKRRSSTSIYRTTHGRVAVHGTFFTLCKTRRISCVSLSWSKSQSRSCSQRRVCATGE